MWEKAARSDAQVAAAAAEAVAGALADAEVQLAATAKPQPNGSRTVPAQSGTAAVPGPPPAAAMAAAPSAPQPLHFVNYREERYRDSADSGPASSRRRWLLADSMGREHLAVDTVQWDRQGGRVTYAAPDVSTLAEAQAALRGLAARVRAASPQHAGLHDALLLRGAVQHWVAAVDVAPFAARLANGEEGGKYRSQHLWATLCCWWRAGHSTPDPVAALGMERRGCLSLPDPEGCYVPAFASTNYVSKGHRDALLQQLSDAPRAAWPAGTHFQFKKAPRAYGSPQLDAVLDGDDCPLRQLLADLQAAF